MTRRGRRELRCGRTIRATRTSRCEMMPVSGCGGRDQTTVDDLSGIWLDAAARVVAATQREADGKGRVAQRLDSVGRTCPAAPQSFMFDLICTECVAWDPRHTFMAGTRQGHRSRQDIYYIDN